MNLRRRTLFCLQCALCAVALAYLVHRVPWYSRVRLHGPEGPQVRLLEQQGDSLVIEEGRRIRTIPRSEAHQVLLEGRRLPDVEVGVRDVARHLKPGWAACALLLFPPVVLFQSLRLKLLVGAQKVYVSYPEALRLTLAGNFFNFALPGTTGGDLLKMYYLARRTESKAEIVSTVIMDRLIGLAGLVTLAGAALGFTAGRGLSPGFGRAIWFLLGVSAFGAWLASRPALRARLRVPAALGRLPGVPQLLRMFRAAAELRRDRPRFAGALVATLLLQTTCTLSAAVMAGALGMRGPGNLLSQAVYFMAHVALGFLVAAVPLTPQGIGVMEAAYLQFFTSGGWNTPSQALAFAVAVRGIQLFWALPGGLMPLLGTRAPGAEEIRALAKDVAPPRN